MLRIREVIKVNDWTITLIANKDVLGGTWEISARDVHRVNEKRPDWNSTERHSNGVLAMDAGRAWAQAKFGNFIESAPLARGG